MLQCGHVQEVGRVVVQLGENVATVPLQEIGIHW